jgi:hypothetical protein
MSKSKNRLIKHAKTKFSVIKTGITVQVPHELALNSPVSLDDTVTSLYGSVLRAKDAKQEYASVPDSTIEKTFALIATNVWRAKNKIIDPKNGEPREEMKKIHRHIEAIQDALTQAGVQTIDSAGRTYDTGMALKVVSFEQSPGIIKEEIKETIKPSVAWKGVLIQIGEVIVGTPKPQKNDL